MPILTFYLLRIALKSETSLCRSLP